MKNFRSFISSVYALNYYVIFFGAAVLIVLVHVNDRCFSWAVVGDWIHLIYLPAGYKLLIVMLFGVSGALAVFLGSIINFIDIFPFLRIREIVVMAGLYAVAPLTARLILERTTGKAYPWIDLRFFDVFILTLACALLSSFAVTSVLSMSSSPIPTLRQISLFLIGDVIGTIIVIYVVYLFLRLMKWRLM